MPRPLTVARRTGPVVWSDPPRRSVQKRSAMSRQLKPVRDLPGRWARLFGPLRQKQAFTLARNLKAGRYAGIDRGAYDARARAPYGDGRYYVWVRFLG